MPTYSLLCNNCKYHYEDFLPFSAKLPTKCPKCKSTDFGQDYSQNNPIGLVKGNPTTFGQIAEANAKRVGKEQMQIMADKDKARVSSFTGKLPKGAKISALQGEDPFWREGKKPLDPSKVKDLSKYIIEGKGDGRTRRKRER